MSVIDRFYTALAQRDHATMGACYADDAKFSDPVFPDLDAEETRAMWRMLLTNGKDLSASHTVLEETPHRAVCRCEARYTFGRTGRQVHNVIHAEFALRDGLIVRHRDRFDFWRWSRQALGPAGLLLGWTPMLRNKVRSTVAASLRKAMAR